MDDHTTKQCSGCKAVYPATSEFFRADSRRLGKFQSHCRPCQRLENRIYAQAHPEKYKEAQHRYYIKNRDRILKYFHDTYPNRKDYIRAYGRKWNAQHRECRRHQTNKWHKNNRPHLREYARKQRLEYPEKVRARESKRRALRLGAPGKWTGDDVKKIFKLQKGNCWWCTKPLPPHYHIDHRIPLTKGGTNWPNNLVLSCPSCNISKHNHLPDEWGERLL